MAFGQVLGHSGETAFVGVAHVVGNTVTTVQGLYRMGGYSQLQRQANQGVEYAVAVALKLNIAVNEHSHGLGNRKTPGLDRQNLQSRTVDWGKHVSAAAWQLLKGTLIEPMQQGAMASFTAFTLVKS